AAGVIAPHVEQAFLAAAILSMAATPFLVRLARRLALIGTGAPAETSPPELRDHVLVIGCGTTGEAVARVLKETGIPFVAVDQLAEHVEKAEREGLPVRFGDATRRGTLEALGVGRARAAVVTVGDPSSTRRMVGLVRQANPDARIIVRARRVAEIEELERLGADEVIPSEFETSIELFVRLLTHLGVPRHVAPDRRGYPRDGRGDGGEHGGRADAPRARPPRPDGGDGAERRAPRDPAPDARWEHAARSRGPDRALRPA